MPSCHPGCAATTTSGHDIEHCLVAAPSQKMPAQNWYVMGVGISSGRCVRLGCRSPFAPDVLSNARAVFLHTLALSNILRSHVAQQLCWALRKVGHRIGTSLFRGICLSGSSRCLADFTVLHRRSGRWHNLSGCQTRLCMRNARCQRLPLTQMAEGKDLPRRTSMKSADQGCAHQAVSGAGPHVNWTRKI